MPVQEKVTVKTSALGNGVYALRRIRTGVKVGEITGKVIDDPDYGSEYCMECGEGHSLEADAPYRYLNHSCDPNCELIIWEGETPEEWNLCLHSIKSIKPGDELTIDYAWPESAAIPCLCRSEKCRGWIVAESELSSIESTTTGA